MSGGSFILTGSLSGDLGVLPAGSFTVASGGSYANPGGVVVNMGTTTVNGAMTASVLNAGTLGGTGTIMGNVLNAGTVAPGNSIGTLSIAGNYMQAASGTYSVEVNGAGQSDLINVGGAARLQGGSVGVFAQPGSNFAPRTTYRILNAAGGLSGTFASVNELYPFLLSSLSYDANNVYLTLQIGGFAAAAQTPTQYAVGATLDAAAPNATGDFATVLGSLATLGTGQVLPLLTGNKRPELLGFLQHDGSRRAALHEQLRDPIRRRHRQPCRPGRGVRRRLRHHLARLVGRLGRSAGWTRHGGRGARIARDDLRGHRADLERATRRPYRESDLSLGARDQHGARLAA